MKTTNKCSVRFMDKSGSDLLVVNAARCSFDKESEWVVKEDEENIWHELNDKDKKLINYLAKHKHVLPFRHPQITLRIEAPIFVIRQLDKHQVGFSTSEVSRRYIDSEPVFFAPDEWRERARDKKQGSGDKTIEHLGRAWLWDGEEEFNPDDKVSAAHEYLMLQSMYLYNSMLSANVAPEQARMVLPQNMMTTQVKTGSLLGWFHLYQLRSAPDAQKEIRDLAELIKDEIEYLYPESWKALEEHK